MADNNLKTTITKLLQTHHLLSANEILKLCKGMGHSYNKTSVYRALDQLITSNLICGHHFSEDETTYELRQHHHAHLVCTNCGEVSSAECTYQEPKNIQNFLLDHHHTTLFGLCAKCQK